MSFQEIFARPESDRDAEQDTFVRHPWFGPPEDELGVAHQLDPDEDLPEGFLRLGLELPDGERISNLGRGRPWGSEGETTGPTFHQTGGGGGQMDDETVSLRPGYWLWPLPPAGALSVFCEWPLVEIPLSTIEVDAGALREAASRTTPLWESM